MAGRSKIEWTDATWNPIRARWFAPQNDGSGKERVGWHREHVSEGCRNCYAEAINLRLGTGLPFKPDHLRREIRVPPNDPHGTKERRGDVTLFLDDKKLLAPLRWRRPRMIFVGSMTDLFADFVTDAMLDRIFAVMALCPQHTFQVLTKRPARMRAYLTHPDHAVRWFRIIDDEWAEAHRDLSFDRVTPATILRNVWLGTSCEDQATANERVPDLLVTPATVRFVCAEPLLGPISFETSWLIEDVPPGDPWPCLSWVIVGGESGPHARPMHPSWACQIRDQCEAAGVPFLFKQWGEWAPHVPVAGGDLGGDVRRGRVTVVHPTGESDVEVSRRTGGRNTIPGTRYVARVGKKSAGRLLDGVTHDDFPEVRV